MAKRTIREWAFAALDLYVAGKEAREVAEALHVEPGEVRRAMAYFKNSDPQILAGGYRPGDPAPRIVDPQALEEARRNGFVVEAEKSRGGTVAKERAVPEIQKTNLQEQYQREIQELRSSTERAIQELQSNTEKAIQELRKQCAETIPEIQRNAPSQTETEQLRALLGREEPAERRKDEKEAAICRPGMKLGLALLTAAVFGGLAVLAWKKSR